MTLPSCSNQPLIQKQIEYQYIPDSLLIKSCEAVEAGSTVRTLSEGYVHNTLCLYTLQSQINAIIEDTQNKKKLNERIYPKTGN